MKSDTRTQYELACRIYRMVAARHMDVKTAGDILDQLSWPVVYRGKRSFPAPAPTWRSCDRWLRFLDITQQNPTTPRFVAPRHSSWF